MADPTNYYAMQQQVIPVQSFGQGYQLGDVIKQQQIADQQRQIATQKAQQMQSDFSAVAANPTPDGITQLSIKYPQFAEHLAAPFKNVDAKQKENMIASIMPIYTATATGNTDIASNLLQKQVEALTNSGDTKGAESANAYLEMLKNNPKQGSLIIGSKLANAMGLEKFSQTYKDLGAEQRAQDLAPAELAIKNADAVTKQAQADNAPELYTSQADETKSKADEAAVTAKNAPTKQLADIKKTEADTQAALDKPGIEAAKNSIKTDPFGIKDVLESGLSGQDLLNSLPKGIASQVKALAEGKMAFPSGMGLKSDKVQQLLQAVGQYDLNFDAVNYNARLNTRKSFTSGKDADNLTALNTALGHMDKLDNAFSNLHNGKFPTLNSVGNWIGYNAGNSEVQKNLASVDTAAKGVAGEMAKVFRSTGMSAAEIEDWKKSFDPNSPPAKIKEVVATAMDMLHSRLDALAEKYNQGMGTTKKGLELLTPRSQEIIRRLEGLAPQKKSNEPSITDADLQAYIKSGGK